MSGPPTLNAVARAAAIEFARAMGGADGAQLANAATLIIRRLETFPGRIPGGHAPVVERRGLASIVVSKVRNILFLTLSDAMFAESIQGEVRGRDDGPGDG